MRRLQYSYGDCSDMTKYFNPLSLDSIVVCMGLHSNLVRVDFVDYGIEASSTTGLRELLDSCKTPKEAEITTLLWLFKQSDFDITVFLNHIFEKGKETGRDEKTREITTILRDLLK